MRTTLQEARGSIVELPSQRPQLEPAEAPFSKADSAWIAIRFLGILVFTKVCGVVYDLVIQLGMIFNLFTVANIVGAEPTGQASFRLWVGVLLLAAQVAVFGLLSYYLLRKGRGLHRVMMFTPRARRD